MLLHEENEARRAKAAEPTLAATEAARKKKTDWRQEEGAEDARGSFQPRSRASGVPETEGGRRHDM